MKNFRFYFLWLSLICVGAFVLQSVIPGFTEIFVLNEKAVSGFEIWRFVSAIFLHGGVAHLMYNLFALLFFGFLLEKLIGSKKFLLLFFGSGIVANIISVNFYGSSLGASGAIMGVLGVLAIIKPLMMVWAFGLILPMFIAAILWVVGDLIGLFVPDGVGHIAHLGGMGVGVLVGIVLRARGRKPKIKKIEIPEDYMRSWEQKYVLRG
jgi:membrane associated rhomboid family serine protease